MAAGTGKIITIGRSYGAGGRSIGRQVAEDLKIPYYDSELLAETAKSSGLAISTVTEEMLPSSFQVPVMAKSSRITVSAGGFKISRDGASVST